MPEVWLAKTPSGALVPVDEDSEKPISRIGDGEVIHVSFKKSRNYGNHKRFFIFINATYDMQEHFETKKNYRNWMTMKAGWYETCVAPNGNVMFLPKSISFDEMDEDEFKELFSSCVDVFLKELGKGITENQLLQVINFT